jgi:hypothetical protein
MKSPVEEVIMPNPALAEVYGKKYKQYVRLGALVENGSLELT